MVRSSVVDVDRLVVGARRDEDEVARRGRVDRGLDRRVVLGDAEGRAAASLLAPVVPGPSVTVGSSSLQAPATRASAARAASEETGGAVHGPSVCGGHPATTMVPTMPLVAVPWSEQ